MMTKGSTLPTLERGAIPARDAWRTRVLREATTVRRVLRDGRGSGLTALGETDTMAALARGSVNELLITPRLEEMRPSVSRAAKQLATEHGAHMTVLTGVAAFELDLAGDGIAAILRRSRLRRRDEALEAAR
jgi:peptide subunit release factor 1 (eRF1)